ncbi:MAG: pantoate--beta-alanine ligase [Candidatus Lernaella stagnicola]|nr:pantoate--beta-alanine ligase [Candidatus Lernaella stagnicola]
MLAQEIKLAKVITTVADMQEWAYFRRAEHRTIGFVPTMGYLHDGHLSLVRIARERADDVVVSIFVNPTQFGAGEDLTAYPRDFERDKRMCESQGADVIFFPDVEEIYPPGYQTQITVPQVAGPLCGVSRPVHFGGVATVCCKLFNSVRPNFAVFGEKDYQQILVVERMVRDLHMDVEIVPGPTLRDPDGLAMSSRNVYMTPEERHQAPIIQQTLQRAKILVDSGERSRDGILAAVREMISTAPAGRIDYIELRRLPNLEEAEESPAGRHLLAVAVYFGKSRLIDNQILEFVKPN